MKPLHPQCPICKGEFKQAEGTEALDHLAKGVLEACRSMQEKNDGGNMPWCPRCGKRMKPKLDDNAESRHEDVYICEECGEDEAMREANHDVLPIMEWSVVSAVLGNH